MINKKYFGAYSAPVCELSESLLDELLCESPGGSTEPYGDEVPFNW